MSVVSAELKYRNYLVVDEDVDYKYLVRLPMDSVTEENATKIMQERDRKLAELTLLKATTEQDLWLNELAMLKTEYIKYTKKNQDTQEQTKTVVTKKKTKSVKM